VVSSTTSTAIVQSGLSSPKSAVVSTVPDPTGGGWAGRPPCSYGGPVRLTEFGNLVQTEFGRARGDAIVADHSLLSLGNRTPVQAIEDGQDPRDVWRALCVEFDVPPERLLGPDD
jgi:hypothetical protein